MYIFVHMASVIHNYCIYYVQLCINVLTDIKMYCCLSIGKRDVGGLKLDQYTTLSRLVCVRTCHV